MQSMPFIYYNIFEFHIISNILLKNSKLHADFYECIEIRRDTFPCDSIIKI